MDMESYHTNIRPRLPWNYSIYHDELVYIVFGESVLDRTKLGALNEERIYQHDIDMMSLMVKIEFQSSLQKEMKGTDTLFHSKSKPNPYDVFLVEMTLDQQSQYGGVPLAICLPISKSNNFYWYNGGEHLIPLNDIKHKWRVASLSGPSRVLENLANQSPLLTHWSMDRIELQIPIMNQYDDVLDQLLISDDVKRNKILKMNPSQRQAVATVATINYFRQGFFTIQGPPGCGKTTCLVSMILALTDRIQIVVVAPSNAAVANVALKVYETGMYTLDDMVVYGENADQSVHFLSPRHRSEYFRKMCTEYDKLENTPTKTKVIEDPEHELLISSDDISVSEEEEEEEEGKFKVNRTMNDQQRILIKDFASWLQLQEDERSNITLGRLAKLCPSINLEIIQGRRKLGLCIGSAKILFCTLNSAGSSMVQKNGIFHTMLIDEAGQTNQAEFFIATNFPNIQRIVVVGDPQQLPSTVIDPDCLQAGYGKSWLQHIHKYHAEKLHLLDTQYRMDPKILAFPNNHFYDNRIHSGDNVIGREPYLENPFLFIDTSGRGSEQKEEFSWKNIYEAMAIKTLLLTDPDIKVLMNQSPKDKKLRVIIITPYRAQMKLLQETITNTSKSYQIEISTVDSFQGQEGDVVIVSTVRTNNVGFVDNVNRLNVAMTRAKRILRVVGDIDFFQKLGRNSVLYNLTAYSQDQNITQRTQLRAVAWGRPNWTEPTLWKAVGSSRFYDCIRKMTTMNQNVCFNTLRAIALPDVEALGSRVPKRAIQSWYTSWLSKYEETIRIVWIAKQGKKIEAHFAGSRDACYKFVQTHPVAPNDAEIIKEDLSNLVYIGKTSNPQEVIDSADATIEPFAFWAVTNATQDTVIRDYILPSASLELDEEQNEVAKLTPPLIIESRSGTGKTLVLLQHAAYHSDRRDTRNICFITVSLKLRQQLYVKYEEMNVAENNTLPSSSFFSFEELLKKLLVYSTLDKTFKDKERCRFIGFTKQRKSHEKLVVDIHLCENEIGGVICGSIDTAIQRAPLSREQYLLTKRSNITNKSCDGEQQRNDMYDLYLQYCTWKNESDKYDINDIVLALLQITWDQKFSSAYLDEVQDLSYASIYLICNLAGKDKLNWVCAGDPAQMISSGCSFTFSGLKETLLLIEEGIESKLSKVHNLSVNYRTTKDVLYVANQILHVANIAFPNAIGFVVPEIAKKDLGIKVVQCDWEAAFAEDGIKMGQNQALIYSSDDPDSFEATAQKWLGAHPFIISTLDSKGLEFDDVIVAFDLDRSTWFLDRKLTKTLTMLRELYVAVTRAKRRVIILIKKNALSMKDFFKTLPYEFQQMSGEMIRLEFDQETKLEIWREKGMELLEEGRYDIASRCFNSSGDLGWRFFAKAREQHTNGNIEDASTSYHYAITNFFETGDYKEVLDAAIFLLEISSFKTDIIGKVATSLTSSKDHLSRTDEIKLIIQCGRLEWITIKDLFSISTSHMLDMNRNSAHLKKLVRSLSEDDLRDSEDCIPLLVGDVYKERFLLPQAVKAYLKGNDVSSADNTTEVVMNDAKAGKDVNLIVTCVDNWSKSSTQSSSVKVNLLLDLFKSPSQLGNMKRVDCMQRLGKTIVVQSFDYTNADKTLLFDYDNDIFIKEVLQCLHERFHNNKVEIVRWFLSQKKSYRHAIKFIEEKKTEWSMKELCMISVLVQTIPEWLLRLVKQKKALTWLTLCVIGSHGMQSSSKNAFRQMAFSICRDMTPREKCLLNVLERTIVSKNFEYLIVSQFEKERCWSNDQLITLVQTIRTISQMLGTVDNTSPEYPKEFQGIFQYAMERNVAVQSIISANEIDRIWSFRAFMQYDISLDNTLSTKSEIIEFMTLYCSTNFPEKAFVIANRLLHEKSFESDFLELVKWWEIQTTVGGALQSFCQSKGLKEVSKMLFSDKLPLVQEWGCVLAYYHIINSDHPLNIFKWENAIQFQYDLKDKVSSRKSKYVEFEFIPIIPPPVLVCEQSNKKESNNKKKGKKKGKSKVSDHTIPLGYNTNDNTKQTTSMNDVITLENNNNDNTKTKSADDAYEQIPVAGYQSDVTQHHKSESEEPFDVKSFDVAKLQETSHIKNNSNPTNESLIQNALKFICNNKIGETTITPQQLAAITTQSNNMINNTNNNKKKKKNNNKKKKKK